MCGIVSFAFLLLALNSLEMKVEALTEEAKEGKCIRPNGMANFTGKTLMDFMPEGGFYLLLQSTYEVYSTFELLLQNKLTENSDISAFCPRLIWKIDSNEITAILFGCDKNITMKCALEEDNVFGAFECSDEYPGSNEKNKTTLYITLSDNETFWVAVLCHEDINEGGWKILSTKELDDTIQVQILEHVHNLGFDASKSYSIDRDVCKIM